MPNIPEAHKLFWMHSIVPLGDEAQVEARFGPFGHSVNLDEKIGARFASNVP